MLKEIRFLKERLKKEKVSLNNFEEIESFFGKRYMDSLLKNLTKDERRLVLEEILSFSKDSLLGESNHKIEEDDLFLWKNFLKRFEGVKIEAPITLKDAERLAEENKDLFLSMRKKDSM